MGISFRTYTDGDYDAVCVFLTELNRGNADHINWNWARFEWMAEHPEFDKSRSGSIGLWLDGGRVVGAAVYDMYFGEAFCAALPEYRELYPAILDYAWRELKDENGLGIAINETNGFELQVAKEAGFVLTDNSETLLVHGLDGRLPVELPDGLHIEELDQEEDVEALLWLVWQGFDHGDDREEFESSKQIMSPRPHFDRRLSLGAVNGAGEPVACCCLWYREGTDYAYVEPVCTIPAYRGKGAARAILFEAMNRAYALGARRAFVISDMDFYYKLGFEFHSRYTFLWKKPLKRIEAPEGMTLIEPTMEYDEQIQAYRREFTEYGGSMDGCGSLRRFDRTEDWLEQIELYRRPETTPEGRVPMSQYIYVREADKKVVGVIQIRHYFNEYLERYAGHIGYSVAPSERRKGYASQMLALALPKCRALGLDRVLISCVRGNEGSRRTILNNGGRYESTVYLAEDDTYFERYWIDLTEMAGGGV